MTVPEPPRLTSTERFHKELLATLLLVSPIFLIALLLAFATVEIGFFFIGAAYFTSVGLVVYRRSRTLAKSRALLLQHKFHVCTSCRYSLSGLPDRGSCPECGHPYDLAAHKPLWCDLYDISDDATTETSPSMTR